MLREKMNRTFTKLMLALEVSLSHQDQQHPTLPVPLPSLENIRGSPLSTPYSVQSPKGSYWGSKGRKLGGVVGKGQPAPLPPDRVFQSAVSSQTLNLVHFCQTIWHHSDCAPGQRSRSDTFGFSITRPMVTVTIGRLMLKPKVCRLRTSNLVGGWSMRYQLPWQATKALWSWVIARRRRIPCRPHRAATQLVCVTTGILNYWYCMQSWMSYHYGTPLQRILGCQDTKTPRDRLLCNTIQLVLFAHLQLDSRID